MNFRPLIATVAVAVSIVATGCGGSGTPEPAGSPGAQKMTDLRIVATGADQLPFFAIIQVAIDKGWFKAKGINATIGTASGGGNTIRAVTTGDADMTIGAPTASVLAAQKETGLKLIGPWFQVNDIVWIGPKALTTAQLSGQTLGYSGAASTTELVAKVVQEKIPGVKIAPVGQMGDNWAASKSGRIAAGWAFPPFSTDKVKNDGAHVVVAGKDYVPNFVTDMVLVNADYAKTNPEVLKNFWKVTQQGFDYILKQPHQASIDIGKQINTDPAVVEQGFKDTTNPSQAYGIKVVKQALVDTGELMVKAGQLPKLPDWKTLLDQQYLPAEDRASF